MEITYIQGDATQPIGEGNKIIAHICNDIGAWGKGFVLAISKRWKKPAAEFKQWYASGENFALSQVQFVQVAPDLWIANIVGQHKLKPIDGIPPVRYEAIKEGLAKTAAFAKEQQATVHMPRIGCGLAGGTWENIEPLIQETLKGVDVTVYDFE
jgi:O-acetyl-ADP-ribose deacetylase (regulator of RNase III)